MGDTLLGGPAPAATPPAAPPAADPPPAAPPAQSGPDWLPEEFRADPTFKDFRDITGLAKSYKHAASLVGVDKAQVVRLPTKEDAPEWAEVYARLGRPEAPDGYEVQAPGGLDEDGLKAFRETAHALGLNKRQAAELMKFYGGRLEGLRSAQEEAAVQAAAQARTALQGEWGNAFEDKLHAANRLIAETGGEELRTALNEAGLGRNPVFLRWLADLATSRAEPSALKGGQGGGFGRAMTPAQAQAEIADLERSDEWQKASRDRDAPGRDVLLKRRAELYAQAYPNQGRAA